LKVESIDLDDGDAPEKNDNDENNSSPHEINAILFKNDSFFKAERRINNTFVGHKPLPSAHPDIEIVFSN